MGMGSREFEDSRLCALPKNYAVAPIPLPSRARVTHWISVWFRLIHCIAHRDRKGDGNYSGINRGAFTHLTFFPNPERARARCGLEWLQEYISGFVD